MLINRRAAFRHFGIYAFTLGLCALTIPATTARAQTYSKIVVFGDSLSDAGNTSALPGNLFTATSAILGPGNGLPKAPYFNGRFSNGQVWVETVAQTLGTSLLDMAYGGARTDTTNVSNTGPFTFPGMRTQVDTFLTANTNSATNAQALYVLWGGANDYLNGGQTSPTAPISNLTAEINDLANAGAKNFLIVNLPNLGQTPGTSGNAPQAAALNALTTAHNSALSASVSLIQQNRPSTSLKILDVNALFQDVFANPGSFGITNTTDSYISNQGGLPGVNPKTVGVGSANNYLFWDEIHPTTTAHNAIAARALAVIGTAAPEPATFALLTVGMGSLGLVRRRTRKG